MFIIIKLPDGKTLEFKRDLSSPEGILRAIVAFANTAGSVLLLGVEDTTRHVRGVAKPLVMEERLANLISDSILPRLIPDIELLPWRRTQVLAVQVYPSPGRPPYLMRAGLDGGVYVRVGSTNRRADPSHPDTTGEGAAAGPEARAVRAGAARGEATSRAGGQGGKTPGEEG